MNCRVDIPEDIRCYQDTLSYASSKVDYSRREGIYMQPSNMNLNIEARTAGYNNEILVSDGTLGLGRNHTVNASAPESHMAPIVHAPMPKAAQNLSQQREKGRFGTHSASAFGIWYAFR